MAVDSSAFDQLVAQVKTKHPNWLELPADSPPTREALDEAGARLPGRLPAEYLDFVSRYGGGDFAFTQVYSLDPASDMYIVLKNEVPWLGREDFIAFSDNGAGDYYGFVVKEGASESHVFLLDHESGELHATGHENIFDFLAAEGLRQ